MTCSFTYWQEKLYKASAIWNKQNFSSSCLPPSSLTIKDAYVSSANRSCRVGSALLKHASLIIDSAKKRYVFLPHDGTSDIILNDKAYHNMSFVPKDSTGVLQAVIRKGSEAYEKGVRTGDYLIEADGSWGRFCVIPFSQKIGSSEPSPWSSAKEARRETPFPIPFARWRGEARLQKNLPSGV